MHKWEEQLSAYIDGELPPSARDELEAHLALCDECARSLRQLRTVQARLHNDSQDTTAPPWLQIEAGLDRLERRDRKRRRVWVGAAVAAAATVAGLLLIEQPASRMATSPPQATRGSYADAVADLEAQLRNTSSDIPPETRAAIEQSLADVDRAIRRAEAALAQRPNDDFLVDYVERTRQHRLRALRAAAAAIKGT